MCPIMLLCACVGASTACPTSVKLTLQVQNVVEMPHNDELTLLEASR
jgi:hypothetical protein